jgi:hypothetical protein
MAEAAFAICEHVAEVQAPLHDHVERGKQVVKKCGRPVEEGEIVNAAEGTIPVE